MYTLVSYLTERIIELRHVLGVLIIYICRKIVYPKASISRACRSHPKVTEAADASHLQLRILNPLSLPIFTHNEVTGKDGEEISVALVDANGNVKSFPEVKLNVVVLHGDFNSGNDRTWSKEDFDGHIVKKRDNKALLAGHRQVTLKGGCAKLVGLKFADNSGFVRTKEFRLGVQVAPSDCEGLRIREAITDPFRVLDCRVKRNGKHDVPQFNDEIWRLRSIGKGGDYRRNLNANGVETVEDFLRLLVVNEQELRRLLLVGKGGMKTAPWKDLINHAKTCISSGKLYSVPTDIADIGVIVLNSFYELSELIVGSRHCSADSLTDDQKVFSSILFSVHFYAKQRCRTFIDVEFWGDFLHLTAPNTIPNNLLGLCFFHLGLFTNYQVAKPATCNILSVLFS